MAGPLPLAHLARRFLGSLRTGPPPPGDEAWALGHLLDGEGRLWQRMSNADRRHAIGVAREVTRRWPAAPVAPAGAPPDGGPARPVLAAALLHDVGKVESGLGTMARVVATVLWAGLDDARAERWATLEPDQGPLVALRGRLGRYRRHPEIGAALLREAGADPLTAAWAGEHHRPETTWTVPLPVGRLLKACDDD